MFYIEWRPSVLSLVGRSSWISSKSSSSPFLPACSFQYPTSFFNRATSLDETFLLGSFTMERTLDAYLETKFILMLYLDYKSAPSYEQIRLKREHFNLRRKTIRITWSKNKTIWPISTIENICTSKNIRQGVVSLIQVWFCWRDVYKHKSFSIST